jgi:hypothetical protein
LTREAPSLHSAAMRWFPLLALVLVPFFGRAEDTFNVAAYNVQNYLLDSVGTRPAKSPEARAKVAENLVALKPDVLAAHLKSRRPGNGALWRHRLSSHPLSPRQGGDRRGPGDPRVEQRALYR